MERDTIQITNVAQLAPPAKKPQREGSTINQWAARVEYTLADGRTITGTVRRSLKREIAGAVEHEQAKAAAGELAANFHDGAFIGTSTTYRIGPPREIGPH